MKQVPFIPGAQVSNETLQKRTPYGPINKFSKGEVVYARGVVYDVGGCGIPAIRFEINDQSHLIVIIDPEKVFKASEKTETVITLRR